MADAPHFKEPGWFTRRVFNPLVAALSRRGLSIAGSRVLEVQGRKSGEWRRTPVNPLELDGARYLVAPRGRRSGCGTSASADAGGWSGRGVEEFAASEVPEAERAPVLRAYLAKWKWEVGAFFDGVGPDSTDEELRRIAADHPVFRID